MKTRVIETLFLKEMPYDKFVQVVDGGNYGFVHHLGEIATLEDGRVVEWEDELYEGEELVHDENTICHEEEDGWWYDYT